LIWGKKQTRRRKKLAPLRSTLEEVGGQRHAECRSERDPDALLIAQSQRRRMATINPNNPTPDSGSGTVEGVELMSRINVLLVVTVSLKFSEMESAAKLRLVGASELPLSTITAKISRSRQDRLQFSLGEENAVFLTS
jgi:hypothetical protein